MNDLARTFITLGALLLVGLLTEALGRRTPLPRVSLMLLFGFLAGPAALDVLPDFTEVWFPLVANVALVMVGFLLGEKLSYRTLRRHGREVLAVSLSVVGATALVVFFGLWLTGVPTPYALLLAGIATATAPAATIDVVHELRAEGEFTNTLLGIVALDDAWGLLVFGFLLSAAEVLQGGSAAAGVTAGLWELGGALLLGAGLGLPLAYLTGRIEPGEPTVAEALGAVLLCGGFAMALDVPFLLASMAMGVVVANLAKHHERPFHAIEGIEWPFLILFFVLAGAALDVGSLARAGAAFGVYVVLRIVGRLAGAVMGTGSRGGRAIPLGLALMPQAGVALGMALLAAERLPSFESYLSIVIAATVFFELVGPLLTRWALVRVGEARAEARAT